MFCYHVWTEPLQNVTANYGLVLCRWAHKEPEACLHDTPSPFLLSTEFSANCGLLLCLHRQVVTWLALKTSTPDSDLLLVWVTWFRSWQKGSAFLFGCNRKLWFARNPQMCFWCVIGEGKGWQDHVSKPYASFILIWYCIWISLRAYAAIDFRTNSFLYRFYYWYNYISHNTSLEFFTKIIE